MKPWIVQTIDEPTLMVITFGAFIDIGAIAGVVGLATTAYNDRKKNKGVNK
jgi:hypothetical protein